MHLDEPWTLGCATIRREEKDEEYGRLQSSHNDFGISYDDPVGLWSVGPLILDFGSLHWEDSLMDMRWEIRQGNVLRAPKW